MDLLLDGLDPHRPALLLAHGAGAPMDSPWMEALTARLVAQSLGVARFEFGYMAGRRHGGSRRPPPPVERLPEELRAALDALPPHGPLVIGGKSMGGRVASLAADALRAEGRIAGLLCLGYPFHPAGKPERLRTAHLAGLAAPTLICQGSRDPLGSAEEVAGYALSPAIRMHWLEDGDHDLKPRKRITGRSLEDHLDEVAQAVARWVAGLAG